MSYQGSPYSTAFHQDDYEFNDDRFDDQDQEDRENEEPPHPDESDEGIFVDYVESGHYKLYYILFI